MEQETEQFLLDLEERTMEKISVKDFECLINKWRQLIATKCYVANNEKQTYWNLYHLKLAVQWYKEHYCECDNKQLQFLLQKLTRYAKKEMRNLSIYEEMQKETSEIRGVSKEKVIWTGNKRELYELIYAIDTAKVINDGAISIKELLVFFEQLFDLDLKNYHSEISKMAWRNPVKGSDQRAHFLEKLSTQVNKRIMNLE